MPTPRVTIDDLPDKAVLDGTERLVISDATTSKRTDASNLATLASADLIDDLAQASDTTYSSDKIESRLGEATTAATDYADSLVNLTSTTTDLENVGAAINTTGKVAGKTVFNTTTNVPVWATGPLAADVWVDATGATAHTPI